MHRFHQDCSLLYVVDLPDLDLGKIIPCCMHLACLLLWYDIYPNFVKIIQCCICIWPVTVCGTIVSGRPSPHQLSIIGILILLKSKPANKSKKNASFLRLNVRMIIKDFIGQKIWEKNGVDNLIGVARLSVESVALRVPLGSHWSALEKSCAL